MLGRKQSLSAGWCVVALLFLAAEAAVVAGDASLPGPTGASQDPNAATTPDLFESLLGPKNEKEYFTPFELMRPDFPANNMRLEIGRWKHMAVLMGFQAEMRAQDLVQGDVYSGGVRKPGLSPGFQTPFGDLSFLARFDDVMDVYYDLYLASRPHQSTTYGHEGFIILHRMPGSLGENNLTSRDSSTSRTSRSEPSISISGTPVTGVPTTPASNTIRSSAIRSWTPSPMKSEWRCTASPPV